MSPGLRSFMVGTSDASLIILMVCLIGFCIDSVKARHRNGLVVRRFADFSVAMVIFFGWFTIVYWDRRYDIWPYHDLGAVMSAEWYWPFRLMLAVAMARLWWAIRGGRTR